jgi:hypothetical protein
VDVLRELFEAQAGTVTRSQLFSAGLDDNAIRRMVRRRELVRVHNGVYVNHTGPLTWVNRAWAAVLFYGDAALCDVSALNLAGDVIHVAIEWPRNGAPLPGVRLHRRLRLADRVLWHVGPPRLRVEEAALDVAGAATSLTNAVGVLTNVCQRRRTTPDRLVRALDSRPRTPRGVELRKVLHDVADGAQSALEHAYVSRVERRHGLPRGLRQRRELTAAGVVHRDVLYERWRVVVELDGQVWHGSAVDRWSDMSRDLVAAADGLLTVRLGWRHAHDEACETAARLATVLNQRGWQGGARACGPSCVLSGRSQSRGA